MSEDQTVQNPVVPEALPATDATVAAVDSTDTWVLDLADLIADPQGEVVVSDVGSGHLTIMAGLGVSSQGLAEGHVTQDGFDVSGFHFVTFENGITLYYDDAVSLALAS